MRYGLEDGSEHTLEEVGRSFTLTRESAFARSKPGPCASCASPLDPASSSHFSRRRARMTPESALAGKSRNAGTACASRRSVPNMLSKITAMAGEPANRNPALPKAKGKILFVGDYPSSQKVRAAILEKQGCAVDTVRDADEGLARWQPKPLRLGARGRRKKSVGRCQVLPRNCQGNEPSAASGPFDRLQRSCDYRF